MKPLATVNERIWLLGISDANQMEDWPAKDIAEFLTSFGGYPTDETALRSCEIESFIIEDSDSDAEVPWVVYIDAHSAFRFKTVDEAYDYFCNPTVYDAIRKAQGIRVTQFTDADIKWAQEYWGNLSDDDLCEFYHIHTSGHDHTWIGVDEYTSYKDYLVISARQSDYERRHDI